VTGDRPLKLLALSPIPEEGAGCRFRIVQYIPSLEAAGFEVTLSTLFTRDFFRLVYQPGRYASKSIAFAGLAARHLASLTRVTQYDLVFLYREVLPIGPAIAEQMIGRRARPPMVFDFDDAIFLPNVSDANRLIAALKVPGKVARIIGASDRVIAGNDYLASYARRFNSDVVTIPTSVDTTRFVPRPAGATTTPSDRRPIVGWIGSPTTTHYLQMLVPVLQRVHARVPFTLRVSGAGQPVECPGVPVENVAWSLDREVDLFNTCDVGVYPLPDDEWAKGKCGFKAIQFMACGVPVVAAAVGVNRDIIEDGVNGFLASTADAWVEKLERLLSDAALRARFAAAGRRTIEARYAVAVNGPRLAAALREVVERSAPVGVAQGGRA
jgi:glycosyltransferase involved in cell wall biosynthesis